MIEIIALIVAGFITGIIGALLGIGGGSILVPILVILFHYPMHTAVAAGLITIVSTSISTAHINFLKGLVNFRLAILFELVTVAFAIIGGFCGNLLNDDVLKIIFGIILTLVAVLYVKESIKPSISKIEETAATNIFSDTYFEPSEDKNVTYTPVRLVGSSLVSAFAGLLSGMLGIGGGVFKVPAMNLLSRMPLKVSIATSNYMIGLTAAGGSIPYLTHGKVTPFLAINMVIGVIFGSKYAASKFQKITDKKLRIIFAVFLVFIAIQMLYKGLM